MKDQMVKTWLLGLMLSVFLFASDDDNWNANFSYELADMCIHNGIEWVAMDSVPAGIEPGTNTNYWEDSEMNCSRTGNCDSRNFIAAAQLRLLSELGSNFGNSKIEVICEYAYRGPFTLSATAYIARCIQLGVIAKRTQEEAESTTKRLHETLGGANEPHNAMKHAYLNTHMAYNFRKRFQGKDCRNRLLAFVRDLTYAHELDGGKLGTPDGEMDNTNNKVAQYYLNGAFYTDFWGVDEVGINWHESTVIDRFYNDYYLANKIYPFSLIPQLNKFEDEHKFVYYKPVPNRAIEMLLE